MTPARVVELHGHRGARGHSSENTIAGFARALDIGVDTLELDLCMSRDGQLMVHHDLGLNPEITRDPNGHWIEHATPLIALDAKTIQAFDVGRIRPGSDYQKRFPRQQAVDGERIPSLETLFQWVQAHAFDGLRFNIEVKSDPGQPDLCAEPARVCRCLLRLIETWGMQTRVRVQSFDWRIQRLLQNLSAAIPTAYLSSQLRHWDTIEADTPGPSAWTADVDVHAYGGSVARAVHAAGGSVWTPDHRDLDEVAMGEATALGLPVVVWTVNEDADFERALDLGVNGLISDYPDRVRQALGARAVQLPQRRPS